MTGDWKELNNIGEGKLRKTENKEMKKKNSKQERNKERQSAKGRKNGSPNSTSPHP